MNSSAMPILYGRGWKPNESMVFFERLSLQQSIFIVTSNIFIDEIYTYDCIYVYVFSVIVHHEKSIYFHNFFCREAGVCGVPRGNF